MTGRTVKGLHCDYMIGRELGRGGEGQVFEVHHNDAVVVKLYNEELSTEKAEKLKYMVEIGNDDIRAYAAWPSDIVTDLKGNTIGFVMRKLVNSVPLHMLFSPMDRKKLFPARGYNFLVHVARNLAAAFYTLHNAGLVIGDVNEGNILIDKNGMLTFIDCDSFQVYVKEEKKYYYCEVGVPRYTPPELLEMTSFENVVRTANTDVFSMAVLIFQLLFLGRHPFAGRNTSSDDIDEETAIKKHYFAYSQNNEAPKLLPPADSLEIKHLSPLLSQLFHQSFEQRSRRPITTEWIKALDQFQKEMTRCANAKMHFYPKHSETCPWCSFREKRGIVYFIDDSYLKSNPLLENIDSFVNGFQVEEITLKPHSGNYLTTGLSAATIPQQFYLYKNYTRYAKLAILLLTTGIAFITPWLIIAGVAAYFVANALLPWKNKLNRQLQKRETDYTTLKSRYAALVKTYNAPPELNVYNQLTQKLENQIKAFRELPVEFKERKKQLEEVQYNEQLEAFLKSCSLRDHNIASFGSARKQILFNNGIRNAADISRLPELRIQGIGPKNMQVLLNWQRQVCADFTYKPNDTLFSKQLHTIFLEINGNKQNLENEIRSNYQAIQQMKNHIYTKQAALEKQIAAMAAQVHQASLDSEAFRRFIQ
ncbi:protein kinase domain-containing protein [Deminuibacter soli]|uniref:Protein kinase domain-containing protein n=1 Tax=Deminuibacter soli TaxID=2291815 RepID=A0A3E1NKJ6_9BACT|nr:protein kinase [Deminuibacter soli]RFM28460.1 hypothetical protein DXN05_06535 [Deminuibacter soli]